MNSTQRSDLPASSISRIAMAIEDELAYLDEIYKKPLFVAIGSQWQSILIKLGKSPKNRNKFLKKQAKNGHAVHNFNSQNRASLQQKDTGSPIGQSLKEVSSIYPMVNIYDKAEETSSAIDAYWCECGLGLSEMGQFQDALAYYDRALQIIPLMCFPRAELMSFRIADERLPATLKSLKANPSLIEAWQGPGQMLEQAGRYKEAVSA